MAQRGRWGRVLLDLFACFLIPAYTLLFAAGRQWLSTNFSVIAVTGPDHYRGFIYWGILAGGYFLVMLTKLSLLLPRLWARLAVRLLTALAVLCLAYALAIPYLPAYFPRYADLHVILAALASVLLMVVLLVVVLELRRGDRGRFHRSMTGWWVAALGSAALFLLAGMVSSALEVYFTIAAALLTRQIWLAAA